MATALLLGDTVPDFTADSSQGELNLNSYLGDSWGIFFSHPSDFTPVCTTELGAAAKLLPEFQKRNVKLIALSVDSAESHKRWIGDIEETQNVPKFNYPIIADPDRKIATLYGMIHPASPDTLAGKLTVRSVFIIDHNKKLRLSITYPASTGRNFDELLRVIDSLQLTDNYKVATPVNWKHGDDVVIVPSLSNEAAAPLFPKGWKEVKPYLRLTPQPNI